MNNPTNDSGARSGAGDRLPYRRPQLGKVRLEADQVLDAGCKTQPNGTSAVTSTCLTGVCSQTIGS